MDVGIGEIYFFSVSLNNHVYRAFTQSEARTWQEAEEYCRELGGRYDNGAWHWNTGEDFSYEQSILFRLSDNWNYLHTSGKYQLWQSSEGWFSYASESLTQQSWPNSLRHI